MAYQRAPGGYGGGQGGGQINFMGRITPTVMYLLIANAAIFVLSVFLIKYIILALSLVPSLVYGGFQFWRVATYIFVHVDFSHFLFNMLILYFFGPPLEQIWGQKKFLTYYLVTGVGAGIVCVPFYWAVGVPDTPIVGASGALFGLLTAFALIYPNARVYVMFLVPVKAKWLVLFFMVMEFAATASTLGGDTSSRVASIAHLSGAIIGYFYLRRLMDLKAYWLRFKMKKKRAYKVYDGGKDEDERGPWLH